MKVRECFTNRVVDPETGAVTFESGERFIERDGILTVEEALAQEALQTIADHNAEIQRQLEAHATASFDDFLSGDKDKIAAIKKRREELRKQLK